MQTNTRIINKTFIIEFKNIGKQKKAVPYKNTFMDLLEM